MTSLYFLSSFGRIIFTPRAACTTSMLSLVRKDHTRLLKRSGRCFLQRSVPNLDWKHVWNCLLEMFVSSLAIFLVLCLISPILHFLFVFLLCLWTSMHCHLFGYPMPRPAVCSHRSCSETSYFLMYFTYCNTIHFCCCFDSQKGLHHLFAPSAFMFY